MNYQIITTQEGVGQMDLIKVRGKAQITLPSQIRKALGIHEGDYLEAEVQDNKVVLIPQLLLDKLETVELSAQGERMLEEALEEVKQGETEEFSNVEDLIRNLKQWS